MVRAAETSRVRMFAGSPSALVDLSGSAVAVEVFDSLETEEFTAMESTEVETQVDSAAYTVRIPTLFYGEASEALAALQAADDASMVVIMEDLLAHCIVPGSFGGMPLSSPTRGRISRNVDWQENGISVDGAPVAGKDRVVSFSLGSTTTTRSDIRVTSGDRVFLLVTQGQAGATLTFGTANAVDVATGLLVEVTSYGTSLTPSLVAAGASDTNPVAGYVLVGVDASID